MTISDGGIICPPQPRSVEEAAAGVTKNDVDDDDDDDDVDDVDDDDDRKITFIHPTNQEPTTTKTD